ncbi:MAG: hypothetical protein RIR59_576, partial [Pseudomonadota bacterium]
CAGAGQGESPAVDHIGHLSLIDAPTGLGKGANPSKVEIHSAPGVQLWAGIGR